MLQTANVVHIQGLLWYITGLKLRLFEWDLVVHPTQRAVRNSKSIVNGYKGTHFGHYIILKEKICVSHLNHLKILILSTNFLISTRNSQFQVKFCKFQRKNLNFKLNISWENFSIIYRNCVVPKTQICW